VRLFGDPGVDSAASVLARQDNVFGEIVLKKYTTSMR